MPPSSQLGLYSARFSLREVTTSVSQIIGLGAVTVALGLATATDAYAAATLAGSAAAAVAIGVLFTYRRFGTIVGAWLFFLFQPLLVALVGEGTAAGQLANVVDIPILLVIGLLGFILGARAHATAAYSLLIAAGVILVCGLASDLAAGAPLEASAIGAVLRLKLFLVLGAALAVEWTPARARRALSIIIASALISAVAGILDFASGGVLRDAFGDPLSRTQRLGFVSAGGLFQNIAVLSTFMAISFTVILGVTWQGRAARRVPQLLLVSLAGLFTLRLKAMVSIPAAALALAAASRRVRSRLLPVAALGAVTLAALVMFTSTDFVTGVFNEQVGKYTSSSPQPRQRLQTVSIEIARDKFPLGVGFGRFGSQPSVERESYSPVYEEYGLTKYYGFSPRDLPIHLALDTSWPGLLGEVGVLGFLVFAATVLALPLLLLRRSQAGDVQADFASIGFAVMVVVLIDSLARPTLFDSFTLLAMALIVAPGLWLVSDRE